MHNVIRNTNSLDQSKNYINIFFINKINSIKILLWLPFIIAQYHSDFVQLHRSITREKYKTKQYLFIYRMYDLLFFVIFRIHCH